MDVRVACYCPTDGVVHVHPAHVVVELATLRWVRFLCPTCGDRVRQDASDAVARGDVARAVEAGAIVDLGGVDLAAELAYYRGEI